MLDVFYMFSYHGRPGFDELDYMRTPVFYMDVHVLENIVQSSNIHVLQVPEHDAPFLHVQKPREMPKRVEYSWWTLIWVGYYPMMETNVFLFPLFV